MFKNLIFFELDGFSKSKEELSEELAKREFTPCAKMQIKSMGFTSPAGDGNLVREGKGALLFEVTIEERKLNKNALATRVAEEVAAYKARRIEMGDGDVEIDDETLAEITGNVELSMIPKVFPERHSVQLMIPASGAFIAVSVSSHSKAEAVMAFCAESLGAKYKAVKIIKPVEVVATEWIRARKAPEGAYLEDTLKLKGSQDGSAVTINKVPVFDDEVLGHIEMARRVVSFRVGLDERILCTIDNKLAVKSIVLDKSLYPEMEVDGEDEGASMGAFMDTALVLQAPCYEAIYGFINTHFRPQDRG